jgi:hypothetical protein
MKIDEELAARRVTDGRTSRGTKRHAAAPLRGAD